MNFGENLRRELIPVSRFLGEIAAPWVTKEITGVQYAKIISKIRPGDVLVTRVYGHLSNVLIPGYWKHAAIVRPDGAGVIEAIGKGVLSTDLVSFCTSKDEVAVVRPTFGDAGMGSLAAATAAALLGAKYDYEFSLGNAAFYCAELVYVAYRAVRSDLGFGPRARLGVLTVTADDFYEAHKWWTPVYDSRDNPP